MVKNFSNSPALNFITPSTEESDEIEAKEIQKTINNVSEENEIKIDDNKKQRGKPKVHNQKPVRTTLAFYEENLKYLNIISSISKSKIVPGKNMSVTEYVNHLIDQDKIKNTDLVEKIKNLQS